MEQIITLFHVDIKMLLAQLVNFGITFAILYYFVIIPLIKMMDERSKKIEDGVRLADTMDERVASLEEDRKNVIAEARKEAQEIVTAAKEQSEKKREESVEKTKSEVQKIIADAKSDIEKSRVQMVEGVQKQTIALVHELTSKILGDVMDDKSVDKEFITDRISKLSK